MKRTDIAMIVLTASISVLAAYFVGNALLGGVKNKSVTVKTTTAIKQDVTAPDERVFKEGAINPTVEVYIGEGNQP